MRSGVLFSTIVMTLSASYSATAQPALSVEQEQAAADETLPDQGVFVARVHPDGSVTFRDRHAQPTLNGFTFDLTDEMMRSHGMEPYADRKLAYLDGTREGRVALGREYRHWQYAHSAEAMQANIDAVWTTVPDPVQRKQALFALWDECAETGEPALVDGAKAARAQLIGFVRQNLRGPDAYTSEELARLNARRTSTATFDPYGGEAQQRVATRTR